MAAGKEIRTKIWSIQSTQKITSAMEMVAASKMRKGAGPYAAGQTLCSTNTFECGSHIASRIQSISTCTYARRVK